MMERTQIVLMLLVIINRALPLVQQKATKFEAKFNALNLHYDHCRHPMSFNKELMKCDCPLPFTISGDSCICIDCIFEETNERYNDGTSKDTPVYINEALEELDKEMESAEDDDLNGENQRRSLEPLEPQRRSSDLNEGLENGRLTNKSRNNKYIFRHHGRYLKPGNSSIDLRINFNDKAKENSQPEARKVKILKVTGNTFSDSVVGGAINGSTYANDERAAGSIESYKGTGALALGSGGGSVGGAAFTGSGSSDLKSLSKGATSEGIIYIGKNATDVSSTTTLLAGFGSATAVNANSVNGTASGASASTNKTASAATAAFGVASSAASAAAGKGDAAATGSANNNAKAGSSATGEGPSASSSSAGDANDKMETLEKKSSEGEKKHHFAFEATPYEFDKTFT